MFFYLSVNSRGKNIMTSNFVSEVDGFVEYSDDQWDIKKVSCFKLYVTVLYSNLLYLTVIYKIPCLIFSCHGFLGILLGISHQILHPIICVYTARLIILTRCQLCQ